MDPLTRLPLAFLLNEEVTIVELLNSDAFKQPEVIEALQSLDKDEIEVSEKGRHRCRDVTCKLIQSEPLPLGVR